MSDKAELGKLRSFLSQAQACLDRLDSGGGDDEVDEASGSDAADDEDDGDMAMKSMKMKLGKYK